MQTLMRADIDTALWRIPGERMKMDSPYTMPLSRQAVVVLERAGGLYGSEGLIFPGRDGVKPLNTMLYARLLGHYGERERF